MELTTCDQVVVVEETPPATRALRDRDHPRAAPPPRGHRPHQRGVAECPWTRPAARTRSYTPTLLAVLITSGVLLLGSCPVQGQRGDTAGVGEEGGVGRQEGEPVVCPPRCLCFRTTVRCMFLHLDTIPQVPEATTILDLRFNRIRDIPPGSFKAVKSLNTLLLNNNHLTQLVNGAFDGLSELKYLYLYKNEIETVESGAFHGLAKLEQLYIHFNRIESLQKDTFSQLPKLERLFLHNNKLQRLPPGIFTGLDDLRRLRLDQNALICDCQMVWLTRMLKETEGHTQAAVTCDSPTDVQGKSLMSIAEDAFHCREPQLTVQPNSVEVSFGNTVYFSCSAEGNPEPEIVWYHNKKEIVTNQVEEGSRFSVLEDGTLMIESTGDDDRGVYECVARNPVGETKANAVELRYSGDEPERPQIAVGPQDKTVPAGDTFTLSCQVSGHPPPEVTWQKNDLPLPIDPRILTTPRGAVTIDDARFDDRGLYRCVATNSVGSISAFARVEVLLPPQFSQTPRDQSVVEGHSAFFSCDATGDPTPTITWTKDGEPLAGDGNVSVNPSGTTLTIQRVRPSDQGVYECQAGSDSGRSRISARLIVNGRAPPTLHTPPQELQAPLGSVAQFGCQADGDPPPSIRWLRNDVPLRLLDADKYEFTAQGGLNIRDLTRQDEGVYQCVAENVAGTTRAYARLTVTDDRTRVITDSLIDQAVIDSRRRVDSAINSTIRDLRDLTRHRTPEDLLRLFRFPSRNALQITRATEIFESTLEALHSDVALGTQYDISHKDVSYRDLLSPTQLGIVADLSGCMVHRRVIACDDMCYHQRYRTFDGTCNNLKNPMWGASLTPLNRLLPAVYDNGFNSPRGWDPTKSYNGFPLPSARKVSLDIASASHITPDEQYTHMLMQWGQFVDHDLDFVPMAVSNARFSDGRFCNETCDYHPPCFPIPTPSDDPRVRRRRCIGLTRSSAMCGSGMTSLFFNQVYMREQVNEITAYMDASNIYGSSDEESRNLRDFTLNRGQLRTGFTLHSGKAMLPPNNGEPIDCQMDPNKAHVPCFQAGDVRANEQLGLLSMHTLWMREHNRVTGRLLELNSHWDGDTLYHEGRKIVGAQLQHITYTHWLPKILGPRGMALLGEYKGYDPSVDATIVNDFATAAYRFGHSLINPIIYRLNETLQPIPEGNLPLHLAFFAPFRLMEEGGIDPIMRGMFGRAAKKLTPGELLNTELTERLFKLAHEVALDLAAVNIQRGRDHGLPSYNAYREHCGLPRARSFEDLRPEIASAEIRRKLRDVYGHVDNIDPWVGGLSEDLVEGARIGPTFLCIIAGQFKRIRDGDRFYYENPGVFSAGQLTELRQTSLARVICDNSDGITQVQRDVFLNAVFPQDFIQCEDESSLPRVDLKLWAHCCYDCSRAGDFRSITNHFRGRRSVDQSIPQGDSPRPDLDLQHDEGPAQPTPSDARRGEGLENDLDDLKRDDFGEHGGHDLDPVDLSPKGMMERMMEMSHDMMDAVDTRIEGMEDVIQHLQKTVRRLSRKLRKVGGSGGNATRSQVSSCIDDSGGIRIPNEKWKVHDCRVCECKTGRVECTNELCQLPTCDQPRKIPGLCCLECP